MRISLFQHLCQSFEKTWRTKTAQDLNSMLYITDKNTLLFFYTIWHILLMHFYVYMLVIFHGSTMRTLICHDTLNIDCEILSTLLLHKTSQAEIFVLNLWCGFSSVLTFMRILIFLFTKFLTLIEGVVATAGIKLNESLSERIASTVLTK